MNGETPTPPKLHDNHKKLVRRIVTEYHGRWDRSVKAKIPNVGPTPWRLQIINNTRQALSKPIAFARISFCTISLYISGNSCMLMLNGVKSNILLNKITYERCKINTLLMEIKQVVCSCHIQLIISRSHAGGKSAPFNSLLPMKLPRRLTKQSTSSYYSSAGPPCQWLRQRHNTYLYATSLTALLSQSDHGLVFRRRLRASLVNWLLDFATERWSTSPKLVALFSLPG